MIMSTLMQASNQWATRPADQRFTSMLELNAFLQASRAVSSARTVSSRRLQAAPVEGSHNALGFRWHKFPERNFSRAQSTSATN
jgi:hypothetical protein